MALSAAERKRRQREKKRLMDVQIFQMELTGTERWCIEKGAARMGYDDKTEYLLDLVYADLKQPAKRACNYPDCNCPFDKPANGTCLKGYQEQVA